jgi:vesicle-associated membrane protein 7
MSIITSLIAKHPDVVLCEYSDFTGNFKQITRIILQRLKPNCKYSIDYDKYKLFYINENKITYLCLTEDISSSTAFSFLEDLKKKILKTYKNEELLNFKADELNGFTDELKSLMVYYLIWFDLTCLRKFIYFILIYFYLI